MLPQFDSIHRPLRRNNKKLGKGSSLENIRLHRTKCSLLLKSVISSSLKNDIASRIKGKKFCILADESTDISSKKHICICVRFFDDTTDQVETCFLGLVPVIDAAGESLFNAISTLAGDFGMVLSDRIGFASDGASNMVGEHNSVWSRIRNVSPKCVKLKCICHSLALCVQKGFEKLPSNLGFLLTEIPSWFKKSAVRRMQFKSLFQLMNDEDESDENVLFPKLSQTRSLVRSKLMLNILLNWEEVKAYFACASQNGSQDV